VEVAKLAQNFVCLRITTMDNVDINLFQFDFDLTMTMFFMNAQSHIYARYGIRKNGSSDSVQSIAGVKDAMRKVLDIHKKESMRTAASWKAFDTQDLVSFKKDPRRPGGCLHCHHAGYYYRKEAFMVGRLTKETVWGFPLPENVGLTLDADTNSTIKDVAGEAAKAGIQAGDKLVSVDGKSVVTPADVTWVLNAFKSGTLKLGVERDGKKNTHSIELKGYDWRKTDISWRQSWWDSGPDIGLETADMTEDERKAARLPSDPAIALKVTQVKPGSSAGTSGIEEEDLIVGVDGKSTDMEAMELLMYVRLKWKSGDKAPLEVIRRGKRIKIDVKLK